MSTSSALEFVPTQGELSVVAAILEYARIKSGPSSSHDGVPQIDSETAVDILQRSDLSNEHLASIWAMADEDEDGNLSERELAIAVRLIGWAQSGKPVNRSFLNYSNGPLPTLKDVWENKWDTDSAHAQLPPVNLHDKIEFHRTFREAGPVNGLLDGDKARDIFLKTNLSFSDLDHIWNLIDTEQRGSLNNIEFAVGMYLIQAIKTCQLTTLPASIPPHIYDQLGVKSKSPFAAPRPPPKSAPLPWKSPSISVKNVATRLDQTKTEAWDVSVIEQAEANRHFDTLDVDKTGLVDGDESARSMLKFFKLPPSDIAEIWELIDLRHDNKLNKDQLAVAVHLIHRRLEGHESSSLELPKSLIPPSMRTKPQNHIRRASAPPVPQKKLPPPPPPASRKPSLSASSSPSYPSLKRATSLSPTTPTTLRPPKPVKPNFNSRFSIAVIPETTSPVSPPPATAEFQGPSTPFPSPHNNMGRPFESPTSPTRTYNDLRAPPMSPIPPPLSPLLERSNSLDQEMVAELRAETKQLRTHVEELMVQLKVQNQYRERNEALKEDNKRMKRRLQDMEMTMTQVMQASEGADRTEELMREVARLTHISTEHENTKTELRETLSSMEELSQDNQDLKQKFEDLKVEKESLERELKAVENKMQNLQAEKNSITTRMVEMEKLLVDPQGKGSSKRELQMLLKDVTKENEQLKSRERDMQQQMSTILLTSRNQAQIDDLKRENSRLKLNVEELDEVVKKMQASSSDNQLRRRISELEREKEALGTQVTEMTRRVTSVEERSGTRVEELQRRCRELEVTNQALRHQQARGTQQDDNAPPPAYSEISVPP